MTSRRGITPLLFRHMTLLGVSGIAILTCFLSPYSSSGEALDVSLFERLKSGGYVIYCRHAETDWSQKDVDLSDLTRCDLQRNLSAEGRKQATGIGESIRALEIPIGAVLASPFCRTRQTAELAFGRVVTTRGLQESMQAGAGLAKENVELLRRLLHEPPPSFVNTVLISHQPLMEALNGLDLSQGECAIFDPKLPTDEPIGRVKSSAWRPSPTAVGKLDFAN